MIKYALGVVSLGLALVLLGGCSRERKGSELRLMHECTVLTDQGERTYRSVVGLMAYQAYGREPGGSGWGGITALATGSALRVPGEKNDFLFLLVRPSPAPSTPGWSQIELVKQHFGLPNATNDESWLEAWETLSQSNRGVELAEKDLPGIAIMPAGGWMDDAKAISLDEAKKAGLRVVRYRLQITQQPVGAEPEVQLRYQPSEARYKPIGTLGRSYFIADNDR